MASNALQKKRLAARLSRLARSHEINGIPSRIDSTIEIFAFAFDLDGMALRKAETLVV